MKTSRLLIVLVYVFVMTSLAASQIKARNNGFGVVLPKGLTAQAIVTLIAPKANASLATLVGMKKWPYRPNTYIVIACLSTDQEEYMSDTQGTSGIPCCKAGYGNGYADGYNPKEVYLAMVEYSDSLKNTRVVAAYDGPLAVPTTWENSELEGPSFSGDEKDGIFPYEYLKFDFAKYKINDKQTAFGIRVGWSEGYAGGGGDFHALMLFAVAGKRIINILSEPVWYSQVIAGDWNDDGSRDHTFPEGGNIVVMLAHKTDGYYDIQMKEVGGQWNKTFTWSSEDSVYLPAD